MQIIQQEMYLTDKAVGHNYGTITNAAGVKDVTGVVVKMGLNL